MIYEYPQREEKSKYFITTIDVLVFNALLYLYYQEKIKEITIPDIKRLTQLGYTTIKYSLQKLVNMGLVEEEKIKRGMKHTFIYKPKINKVHFLSPRHIVVSLRETLLQLFIEEDLAGYVGTTIDLDEAPLAVKKVIEKIRQNTVIDVYKDSILEEYLDILFSDYLKLREKYLKTKS